MNYDLLNLELLFRVWIVAQKKMELVGAMDWSEDLNEMRVISVNTETNKLYRDPKGVPPGTFGDEFILMQATPFRDRSTNQRIFASDIIRTNNIPKWEHDPGDPMRPEIPSHFFGFVKFGAHGYEIGQPHDAYTPSMGNIHIDSFEIIGNIYQHPERNVFNG